MTNLNLHPVHVYGLTETYGPITKGYILPAWQSLEEKERYARMHAAGKTDEARADLERRIQRFDQADAVFDPDWGSAFQGAFDLEDPAAVDGAAPKPHDD